MSKDAKYVVRLEAEEREKLGTLIAKGGRAAAVLKRVRVLLKADESDAGPGWNDQRIAEFAEVSLSTVHRIRQQFVEEGFEAAVFRKSATTRQYRKLDGAQEAHLIAIACGRAPKGRARWTMQLLADRLVELEIVDSISDETVRRTLKKRPEAAFEKTMGNSAKGQCRLCLRHGRCAGSISATV